MGRRKNIGNFQKRCWPLLILDLALSPLSMHCFLPKLIFGMPQILFLHICGCLKTREQDESTGHFDFTSIIEEFRGTSLLSFKFG